MSVPLKIGMFGGGTVGGGVYEIIEQTKKELFKGLDADISIAKICVRDKSKPRSFTIGGHTELVTDYDAILEDDSINCVVELMGGVTHAKDVVFKALSKGKHVITANKALLAEFLPQVKDLLKQNPGAKLGFEAAVCGGIPIIRTMQSDYVGDDVSSVMGIMNGTTNFMLTKMELEGADYGAVLKEAQDLGFAEADPTADVEGFDVQAKIALLAKLAFGQDISLDKVPCTGISKLSSVDFACAKQMGRTIKLVGTAKKTGAGGDKLAVYVSPVLVLLGGPLASARGPGNIVVVGSKNLTEAVYTGPGAGRYPTANSVVSDIVRLALGSCGGPPFPLEAAWDLDPDFQASFYVRCPAADGVGVLAAVGQAAAAAGVVVASVTRRRGGGGGGGEGEGEGSAAAVDVVVTTDTCRLSQVEAFCAAVPAQPWSRGAPVSMSLL